MASLEDYIKKFESLGCAIVKGQRAPHKPILLLAVIDEISFELLSDGLIILSPALIERFNKIWEKYVGKSSVFKPNIQMPFYHLHTEGFWELIKSPDYVNRSGYSLNQLKVCFVGAQLPEDLTLLITNPQTREKLKNCLLQKYFNIQQKEHNIQNKTSNPVLKTNLYKPMTYFDRLLANKGYEVCPIPLWKLRITNEEYEQLRERLAEQTKRYGVRPFWDMPREACLFFAEFWRREYVKGSHSRKMVFDALRATTPRRDYDYSELLYSAAKRGAKMLGIETFDDWNRTLDDLLYQGGLPMQKVLTPDTNSVWDRFTTGLVFRNIDFDELNLGVVAKSHKGLREFCNVLCDAVDKRNFMLLPYYCQNEADPLFQFLLDKFSKVKRNYRLRKPFLLRWELELNGLDGRMTVKYDVSGQQTLSAVFLEQQNLDKSEFISVQVKCNGAPVDTFDFNEGFCRYEIRSKHQYRNGDEIAIFINDRDSALITESLDMSVPHLMYKVDNGKYELGNRLGKSESAIIIPEDWIIHNVERYTINTYKWDNTIYKGIIIPESWTEDIIISGEEGNMIFGANVTLYWTELISPTLYLPVIRESVYNADTSIFKLCYDLEGGETKNISKPIKFRNKWSDAWYDKAPFGEIFAKAENGDDAFVTQIKFINVGEGLSVQILDADNESCRVRVVWPHGKVFTPCGQKQIEDVWLIKKSECDDIHSIPFIFTPTENYKNEFTLTLKAPFKDFSIGNPDGIRIKNDSWIPYSDLDKYQYHLSGMNIRKFTVGSMEYSLRWNDDKLYLYQGLKRVQIPYDGQLIQILGSREGIRAMLDKTAQNMLNAQVEVVFHLSEGKKLRFYVKDSPYRPRQIGNKILIIGNHGEEADYKRALKLYKLDEPTHEPETIYFDEENGYVLPASVKDWGKVILTGRSRGRICPTLVEFNRDFSDGDRKSSRADAISVICNAIESATFGDSTWKRVIGWFNLTQKEDLPASSFLDLVCTSRSADSLIKLAFQLYCSANGEDEQNLLLNRLKYLSDDLAFQWYWLIPKLHGIGSLLQNFISDPRNEIILTAYLRKAQQSGNSAEYIMAIPGDKYYDYCLPMLIEMMNNFSEWMKTLCRLSMEDAYVKRLRSDIIPDCINNIIVGKCQRYGFDLELTVDVNQWDLDDETKSFFLPYYKRRFSLNENWLLSRVEIMSKHIKGEIDLFKLFNEKTETNADKIRRSLIFCYKMTQRNFLFELNNKLSN